MKWTENQEKAIFRRGKNLLLSAAAGSGKTAVLTERIVQCLIEDNSLDIDQMLVVTFTKAATAEMKKRIMERIIDAIDAPETSESVREHLKRQLSLIQNANISTLDSFCGNVVRKFFTISGVDSSTSVGDDGELRILSNDVLDDLLEEYYEKGEPEFKKLAGLFYSRLDPDLFRNTVLRLYEYILNLSEPFAWLDGTVKDYDWKIEYKKYKQSIFDEAYEDTLYLYNNYGDCLKFVPDMMEGMNRLKKALEDGLEPDYEGILPSRATYKPISKTPDEDIAKAKYNAAKSALNEHKELSLKYDDSTINEQIAETKSVIEVLIEIVKEYDKRLKAEKEKKNILSFSDVIHKALAVLKTEEASAYYKDLFKYIFVDEYQDITEINDAIIDAVSGDNNVFRVGDVKQCIYGFREACPELFIGKADAYEKSADGKSELIKLSENFRSRKEVLESVNQVFRRIMRKETVGITYNPDDELHPRNEEYPEITKDGENPYTTEFIACGGTSDGARVQAKAIADRIEKLMNDKLQILCKNSNGQTRDIKYGDISILMRNATHNQVLIEELGRRGIPAYAGKGSSIFEEYDIVLLLAYLKIIDNPLQDIPLLTVMRSPLYDFSDEDIARLVANTDPKDRKNIWIYEILKRAGSPKYAALLNDIKYYSEIAQSIPVSALIWKIITGTGYYRYVLEVSGESRGLGRQYSLRYLFDIATAYEQTRRKGLHRFIKYLERRQREGNNLVLSAYASATEDAVCINTIHASKGLEYPVVFLFGAKSTSNGGFYSMESRENKNLVYDRFFGIDLFRYDAENRVYCPTFKNLIVKEKNKKKIFDEEMRLLYVAMTRAREKLILVGMFKDPNEVGFENSDMTDKEVNSAKNYSDWVLKTAGGDLWKLVRIIPEDETEEEENQTPVISERQFYGNEKKEYNPTEWYYAHQDDKYIKSKISVTDLKRIMQNDDEHVVPYRKARKDASRKSNAKFTAAEQGTIIHEVLRRLDFKACIGKNESELRDIIKSTVDLMAEKGFLLEIEKEAVVPEFIINFLKSEIGKRACASEKCEKEVPFTILLNAEDVLPGYKGETVMQGIIDCCFIEDGEYVIVDYKSDDVSGEDLLTRAESYYTQVNNYSAALSKITGVTVKEKQLFFLREGTAVIVP